MVHHAQDSFTLRSLPIPEIGPCISAVPKTAVVHPRSFLLFCWITYIYIKLYIYTMLIQTPEKVRLAPQSIPQIHAKKLRLDRDQMAPDLPRCGSDRGHLKGQTGHYGFCQLWGQVPCSKGVDLAVTTSPVDYNRLLIDCCWIILLFLWGEWLIRLIVLFIQCWYDIWCNCWLWHQPWSTKINDGIQTANKGDMMKSVIMAEEWGYIYICWYIYTYKVVPHS